jgi:hypothetical protein
MTGIAILSPGHPRVPGGVTDHTSRLVEHWSEGHDVVVASDTSERPDQVVAGWSAKGVTSALIQYVPFLYGRRGLSRFPERIAAACGRAGIRVTLFVHEPWVPLTRAQWLVTGPLQRIQLHRLMRHAVAAATAVPAWRELVEPKAELIYVGSTLGERPPSPGGRGAGGEVTAPVVFSPFAAGLDWKWIVAAANAIGAPRGLVVLGASESEAAAHSTVSEHMEPGWDWRGRLPAEVTLALLARARLVLSPFIDGLTGRRTSACAALSTGSRVLSSSGHLFDPFFRGAAEIADTAPGFAERATRLWATPDTPAERAQRVGWYDQHLHPRLLDARLLSIVTGASAVPAA